MAKRARRVHVTRGGARADVCPPGFIGDGVAVEESHVACTRAAVDVDECASGGVSCGAARRSA